MEQQATRRKDVADDLPVPPIPPWWIAAPARAASRLTLRRMFDIDHAGKEHIPKAGGAIIISNHPTYVDPWMIGLGTPRWITWMAWEDAFSWPLVGAFVRSMGAFPVNLDRPQPSTIKAARRVLDQGRLLGVFFEGGRTQSPDGLDPPRRGGARLAITAGVPVVPVSIVGARRAWPLDRAVPRPGRVRVVFHPTIDPERLPGTNRDREERLTEVVAESIRHGLANGRPRPRA